MEQLKERSGYVCLLTQCRYREQIGGKSYSEKREERVPGDRGSRDRQRSERNTESVRGELIP
jgi:hypothetical protein